MDENTTTIAQLTTEYAAVIAGWLQGADGRETLRLLGNILPPDFTTDTATEYARTQEILADENKLAWIILFEDEPAGVAEANLKATPEIVAPYLSYFVGDKASRGNGIGTSALGCILDDLQTRGYTKVFARTLTENIASQKVLQNQGFAKQGTIYADKDGLTWQNYQVAI